MKPAPVGFLSGGFFFTVYLEIFVVSQIVKIVQRSLFILFICLPPVVPFLRKYRVQCQN